jgi:cell division protein FtsZ
LSPSVTPGGAPPLTVVGVGGAGVNAVSRLLDLALPGVRALAVDTSVQTLARVPTAARLPLVGVTRGLGTGGEPRLGAAAALAAERQLLPAFAEASVVLVVAGLAGGTGGGAGPEVARLCRQAGALTLGFGIRPFAFESRQRQRAARRAALGLARACDTSVLLDNEASLALAGGRLGLDVALRVADDLVRQAVHGLGGLLAGRGWIKVDLAHVRRLLADGGGACLSVGLGGGDAPAQAAMAAALASPLADMGALARARAVLVHITGGRDLAIADTAEAVASLRRRLPERTELVVGAGLEPALAGRAEVMIVAAGPYGLGERTPAPQQAPQQQLQPALQPALRQASDEAVRPQPIPWRQRPPVLDGRLALREVG